MNIRELRAEDLAALLGLSTHLHKHNEQQTNATEEQAIWTEALANPRIRYFEGWDEGLLVASCTLTIIPNLTRACRP